MAFINPNSQDLQKELVFEYRRLEIDLLTVSLQRYLLLVDSVNLSLKRSLFIIYITQNTLKGGQNINTLK